MNVSNSEFDAPRVQGPFDGALIMGANKTRFRREFGIYDTAGFVLPDSDIKGQELSTFPAQQVALPDEMPMIEGPALFAGLVLEQFGHVLMNSIGRLWALDKLPSGVTLVFVPKRRPAPRNYPFLRMILDMLGVPNKFVITKGPVRIPELFTASDLFGERYMGRGAPYFYEWLDGRFPVAGPITKGRKLYLTRSKLGMKVGRFACEDHLEHLLAAQGYEIIAPETVALRDQVALYRDAEKLIFSESSALHLFSMVRRPDQRAAVIQRRETLPELISTQMNDLAGPDVAAIHALRRIFWPPLRSDHLSVSLLDFRQLRTQLVEAGLIDGNSSWALPEFDDERASLNAGLEPDEKLLNHAGRKEWLRALRATRGEVW